jgi:hypothetical protein
MMVEGQSVNFDMRSSLAFHLVPSSMHLVHLAERLEEHHRTNPLDAGQQNQHKGYVIAAVMQAVGVLESEAYELCAHGPGHHLGKADENALAILFPRLEEIDALNPIRRFNRVLALLGREPIKPGSALYDNADLVVQLRKEVVHFKSTWHSVLDKEDWIEKLRGLGLPPPSYLDETSLFFPHQCLSAACALWAVETTRAYLKEFYVRLGYPDRYESLVGQPGG